MAGNLPQVLVQNLWSVHLLVIGGKPSAHIGDQRLVELPAFGVPEDRARPLLLEVEEVHLARELAMVAPLRLLELLEIGVELLPPGKGGGVDPREHRLRRIAAPVGARNFHQLERVADFASRGHVGAAAKVGPIALAIKLDLLVERNGVDEFDLECFAFLLEEAFRLVARDHRLGEGLVARDDLAHALLDRREILGRERLVAEEVVIEPVLDHRPDRHLRAGPQRLHRLGQYVRRVVSNESKRPRVVTRDEFEGRILRDRIGEIDDFAVAHRGDRALGKRGRDGFGDVEAGDAGLKGAHRAVGKGDVYHQNSLCSLADTNRRKRRREDINAARARGNGSGAGVLAMSQETLVRRVVVEGLVQGVGYREFTRSAALKFRISGWVRNRADGTVEAVVKGAPSNVESMLAEMRRGPRSAAVTGLKLLEPDRADEVEASAFVIRSTL